LRLTKPRALLDTGEKNSCITGVGSPRRDTDVKERESERLPRGTREHRTSMA
jgi:hypothetical protein